MTKPNIRTIRKVKELTRDMDDLHDTAHEYALDGDMAGYERCMTHVREYLDQIKTIKRRYV